MGTVSKFTTPKKRTLINMRKNDVFRYMNLGEVSFVRWKRGMKSFEATQVATGRSYSCRTNMHESQFDVLGIFIEEKKPNDINKLQPGNLFIIQNRNTAEIFKFVEFGRTGKIKAVNPVYEERKFTIDNSFEITLLKNIL
jgi:hypothetical protein